MRFRAPERLRIRAVPRMRQTSLPEALYSVKHASEPARGFVSGRDSIQRDACRRLCILRLARMIPKFLPSLPRGFVSGRWIGMRQASPLEASYPEELRVCSG